MRFETLTGTVNLCGARYVVYAQRGKGPDGHHTAKVIGPGSVKARVVEFSPRLKFSVGLLRRAVEALTIKGRM